MAITDTQLFLAIGLPTFAVLMNIAVSSLQMNTINARIGSLEVRFLALGARFDTLIGKVIEIDNRLTRVEERLERR